MIGLLTIAWVFLGLSRAAPTTTTATFDQRQDGKFNLHAKLENFLVVVVAPTPGGNDLSLLGNLAGQALELKNLAARGKDDSAAVEYKTDAILAESDEQPYEVVEIVSIQKKNASECDLDTLRQAEEEETSKSEEAPKAESPTTARETIDDAKDDPTESLLDGAEVLPEQKRARSLWSHLGDLIESRSRMSLKKELSKDHEDDAIDDYQLADGGPSSLVGEKNEVDLVTQHSQELKLLGGAIENCGPGRYRDSFGICQFDESLLK